MPPPPDPIKQYKDLRMQICAKAIEKNLNQQIKTAARHENWKDAKQFNVGDFVMIPNTNPGSKIKDRKKGPYVVTQKYSCDRYRIENIDKKHRKYNSIHSAEHLSKITLN